MTVCDVDQNPTLPQRQPTRYQRRSAAERSFALNAVPEQPEEPPLQTLPRDLLRAHVFEAVNLWDLGRLGCAASANFETAKLRLFAVACNAYAAVPGSERTGIIERCESYDYANNYLWDC